MARIPKGYNAGYDPNRRITAQKGRNGRRAVKAEASFLVALWAWLRATYATDEREREVPGFRAPQAWEAALLFAACLGALWWMLRG